MNQRAGFKKINIIDNPLARLGNKQRRLKK